MPVLPRVWDIKGHRVSVLPQVKLKTVFYPCFEFQVLIMHFYFVATKKSNRTIFYTYMVIFKKLNKAKIAQTFLDQHNPNFYRDTTANI